MAIYLNIIQWKYITPIYTIAPIYTNETGINNFFLAQDKQTNWFSNEIVIK